MKKIFMTGGHVVLVDDEDYKRVAQYKWHFSGYANRTVVLGYKDRRNFKGRMTRQIKMHRFILNAPEGMDVDHINGNKLDNRKRNLRVCTHTENTRNVKRKSNNTSGYIGVHWHKRDKKWNPQVKLNGKRISLGYFDDINEAVKARDAFVAENYNGYGVLNNA